MKELLIMGIKNGELKIADSLKKIDSDIVGDNCSTLSTVLRLKLERFCMLQKHRQQSKRDMLEMNKILIRLKEGFGTCSP